MPTSITIRDVPDDTAAELVARAAAVGQTLQDYLRGWLVELAAQPNREAVLARLRQRKAATGSRLSAEAIVEDKDADRR